MEASMTGRPRGRALSETAERSRSWRPLALSALVLALLAAALIGPSSAAASTTYFASPSGSDAISCAANSHADPFATIQAALACTTDGDAVSLAPSGATPYPGIGTVSHNVTIEAEAGAHARTVEAGVSGVSGPMTVPAGVSATVAGVAIDCVDGLPPDFQSCGSNITNNGALTLQGDSVRGSTNAAAIKNFSPDGGSAHLIVLDS